MKVLLTGSSGFLGFAISKQLENSVYEFLPVVRVINSFSPRNAKAVINIDGSTDYSNVLEGISTVVHAAARAHIMEDEVESSLAEYQKVNVFGSTNLARQAAAKGVKRFIFISSIKVNGESTSKNSKFTSSDEIAPNDPYGISKAEAEKGLLEIAKESGMEVVIIRSPLVYGPGVKGNFLNLLKLSKLPVPLPFRLINNKRSMIYLDNLVDFIITCIDHPGAANKIFLVSDGDDLSLARLLTLIRKAMNKFSWLIPVPPFLFSFFGKISGKSELVGRLTGNLQVDSIDAKKYLNWTAPYSVEEGIKYTVDDFLKNSEL